MPHELRAAGTRPADYTDTAHHRQLTHATKGEMTMTSSTDLDALNAALLAARADAQRAASAVAAYGTGNDAMRVLQHRAALNAAVVAANGREAEAEIAALTAQLAAARLREEAAPRALAEAEAALGEATRAAEAAKQTQLAAERAVIYLRSEQGRREGAMRQSEARLSLLGAAPTGTLPPRQPPSVAPGRR